MSGIARLRPLSLYKIIKILKGNGFQEVRAGRHKTFKKIDASGKVWITWVPQHIRERSERIYEELPNAIQKYNEITVFVIKYIIRQSGKDRDEFC